jgi:integrase
MRATSNENKERTKMAYVVEKAGTNYAVIYEGVDPITGRERRRWHRCGTRVDAESLACQLAERRARRRRAGSTMTLGDYLLGQWLPTREAALSPTTYARYLASVEHYLLPHLGHVQLRQLHADQLTSLYRRLAVDGSSTGGPLAAKTILNLHQLIRTALDDAVTRELILHNPALDLRPPDPRKRPSARRRAASWTADELGAFLNATRATRHWMLFRLAAATGMRRGELLGLRWSDVHLDTGRLEITQALTAIGYTLSFSLLKTKTSRRCITLDPDTVRQLTAWQAEQTAALAATGQPNRLGLVFTGHDGGPLHPHLASQAFERAHRGLAVRPIRMHDLRHTHASLLLRDRVPIKVVSERLGHANPAFTMMTYQHVLPGMQDDAARVFATILSGSANSAEPVAAGSDPVEAGSSANKSWPEMASDQDFSCGGGRI